MSSSLTMRFNSGSYKTTFSLYFVLVILSFFVVSFDALAQDRQSQKTQEYIQQQDILRKSAAMREYDSAIFFMEEGMHARADEKFKYVLANLKSIPSDLTFNFGKNSFQLKYYKQSIDWLNKYIQLKGTNGQFSNEAIDLKKRAEVEFLKEKSQNATVVEEVLSTNYDLDCGPTGKVICPVCKGDHVVIKKGVFGNNDYKTCPYCDEHGILTCDEYNQLLRGQLKPKL
jgi:tetratricopeptide (TPR) repeat protein